MDAAKYMLPLLLTIPARPQGNASDNPNAHGVYIELGKGTFEILADIPSLQGTSLGNGIRNFFTTTMPGKKIFLGATVLRRNPLPALMPQRFYMTTIRPDLAGPGVLLMYITTNGVNGNGGMGMDVLRNPLKRGHSAALYINSRILFQQILLPRVSSARLLSLHV
jgi:hypothetical protein